MERVTIGYRPHPHRSILAPGGDPPPIGRDDDFRNPTLVTEKQMLAVANDDRTLWIERSGMPEEDIDNARIQGGTNHIDTVAGDCQIVQLAARSFSARTRSLILWMCPRPRALTSHPSVKYVRISSSVRIPKQSITARGCPAHSTT